LQTLLGPAVSSLEFTLRHKQDDHLFFQGLHPGVQPKQITVAAVPPSVVRGRHGAYAAPECHAALVQFISALSSSSHRGCLEQLCFKVCGAAEAMPEPGVHTE
jgi:hypothetical protein